MSMSCPLLPLLLALASATLTLAQRPLVQPEFDLCSQRPKHLLLNEHRYFVSWLNESVSKLDWLDARNYCRRRCMDTVSIETPYEWHKLRQVVALATKPSDYDPQPETEDQALSIWTSGHLCDFDGCEKSEHVKPVNIKGWFWSGNNKKISPTTCISGKGRCFHGWSDTGKYGFPQPDSRELREDGIDGNESCLALLYNAYDGDNGLRWHDKACYHLMYFICEDSDSLLRYARFKWGTDKIPK